MTPSCTRAALALCTVLLAASVAHADISMPPPLRFHLGRVTAVDAETTAPAEDVQRAIAAARDGINTQIRAVERCASRAHGGFSWRDHTERHAGVRVVWDGSPSPTETRIVSSTFAHDIGTCIRTAVAALAVTPTPAGRVTLTLSFDRD